MKDLNILRQDIDQIDDQIVDLIARRFGITREIGRLKADQSTPALDKTREDEIFSRLCARSESLSVNPDLVRSIFRSILSEVVSDHHNLRKN